MLIKFLHWFLNYLEPPTETPYHKRAFVLMSHQNDFIATRGHTSGEYKAHQVYAQLQKEFPEVRKCDLRYEMEKVYQKYFRDKK